MPRVPMERGEVERAERIVLLTEEEYERLLKVAIPALSSRFDLDLVRKLVNANTIVDAFAPRRR